MLCTYEESAPRPEILSPREREVIRLVVFGRRNAEVAQTLSISEATVKKHLSNVFEKLGIHRRRQLQEFVFVLGIV